MKVSRSSPKGGRYDVCEIFSPPRTTRRATHRGARGGWSLDIATTCTTTGRKWNLLEDRDQRKARSMLRRDKPQLLIASPPCTKFSNLQKMNKNKESKTEDMEKAIEMIDFAVDMCTIQLKAGRKFVFEHPSTSAAWNLPSVRRLAELEQ